MNNKRNKPWQLIPRAATEMGSLSRVVNLFTLRAALSYLNIHGLLFFIPVIKYLTRGTVREDQFILAYSLGDAVLCGGQSMATDSSTAVRTCGSDLVDQSEEMVQEAICYKPQALAPRDPYPSDRTHTIKVS